MQKALTTFDTFKTIKGNEKYTLLNHERLISLNICNITHRQLEMLERQVRKCDESLKSSLILY